MTAKKQAVQSREDMDRFGQNTLRTMNIAQRLQVAIHDSRYGERA